MASFKAALNETVSSMTDDQFFLSKAFAEHINTLAEGVTERYRKGNKIRIKIVKAGKKFIAFTDNYTVTVNIDCPWIATLPSRMEKYYLIVGIVLHECGHMLYTDFGLMIDCVTKLEHKNILFPKIEESPALSEALENKMGRYFAPIYKGFDNAVEDGHIEKRVIRAVPGYGECLMKVRDIQRSEEMPTYAESLEQAKADGKKVDKISMLHNLVLMYAKYGISKIGKVEKRDELCDAFEEAKGYIDAAVGCNSSMMRRIEINKLFNCLVQFIVDEIKRELEERKKKSSKSSSSSESSSSESTERDSEGEEGESEGGSEKSDGSTGADDDSSEEDDTASGTTEESDESKDSEGSSSEETDGETDEKSEESEGSEGSETDELPSEAEKSEDTEDTKDTSSSDEDDAEPISDEEIARELEEVIKNLSEEAEEEAPEEMTERSSSRAPLADNEDDESESESSSSDEKSGDKGEPYSKPEADKESSDEIDLGYLEKIVAEEIVAEEIHSSIEKAMAKISDATRKGRIDKCPSVEKYLEPTKDAEEDYQKEHEELDRIARRVVKNLDKIIKERQIGDVQRGLYVGKQLDSARAYRRDHKIMANKILPEDIPDMEVVVLVDCSGSMSWGERMPQSKKCAYITWKFCQQMKIPCSVYGHTTTRNRDMVENVLMQCVAHKDNADKEDGKRIFTLEAISNNRDGWALNFCAETLSRSEASKKILFVISDGLPAASGYSYAAGKKDIREVIKRYKKAGISFVAAGIDECAPDIRDVYIEGVPKKEAAKFMDFSDMNGLPKAFANILKKELL